MPEVPPHGGAGGGAGQGDGGERVHSGEEGNRRVQGNRRGRGSRMELEGPHKVEVLECIRTGGLDLGRK